MARYRVAVNYRSGTTVQVDADELEYEGSDGKVTRLRWEGIDPYPLWAGLSSIESIWVLEDRGDPDEEPQEQSLAETEAILHVEGDSELAKHYETVAREQKKHLAPGDIVADSIEAEPVGYEEFYSVRHRRKVRVPVEEIVKHVYERETSRGVKTRYAFQAETTVDGDSVKLTKFVDEETFDRIPGEPQPYTTTAFRG